MAPEMRRQLTPDGTMILMYHHIAPAERIPRDREIHQAEGWDFTVTPESLDFHLSHLRRKGFEIVSFSTYLEGLETGARHQVAITFDDGWADNFEFALPVLERNDAAALFFLVSQPLEGIPASSRMTAEQVASLLARGHTIGAHTRKHATLPLLTADEQKKEIRGSREELENEFATRVDYFAYPGGAFDVTVAEVVKESGFRAACCSIPGGKNSTGSRYWLSREIFDPGIEKWRNRFLFSKTGSKLLHWRASRILKKKLHPVVRSST